MVRISIILAVSQWMAFVEDGFQQEKAEVLIASHDQTKEYLYSVRLPMGG